MSRFPKQNRLLVKSDFETLREGARRYSAHSLIIFYKANQLNQPRMGISVSSQVFNAPERNRLKRLFREKFRKSIKSLESFDFLTVVAVKKKDKDLAYYEANVLEGFKLFLDKITKREISS